MKIYHCFWREPIGNAYKYEATEDLDRVQALVTANADYSSAEFSNVSGLRVIYGELLEFEPAQVVTKWKIKEPLNPSQT